MHKKSDTLTHHFKELIIEEYQYTHEHQSDCTEDRAQQHLMILNLLQNPFRTIIEPRCHLRLTAVIKPIDAPNNKPYHDNSNSNPKYQLENIL